jgi:peptidoglycan/LPS O-acetylase OafA/YrhL
MAGFVVMVGALAIMLGVWLPWRITRIPSPTITVHIAYALIMTVIGTLTLIGGSTLWRKGARPARLMLRLWGFAECVLGAYDLISTTSASVPGPGQYLFCIGALLVVVGSFLQCAAPAPGRVG